MSSNLKRVVELIDTSLLLNVLRVPFESDHADKVMAEIDRRANGGVELRLPFATLVEVRVWTLDAQLEAVGQNPDP